MTAVLPEQNTPLLVSTGEDDLRQFLREIREYPLLSAQEERELARRCAEGDEDAIRQLVNSNLRLVVSVAREYAGRGAPLLDLIQEGSIGLLAAVRKFDYTLDYRFSTYATKWIRRGVTRYLAGQLPLIRVPDYTAEQIRRLEHARGDFQARNGQKPTISQLADACDLSEQKVRQLLQLNPETCSLDAATGEHEDGSLGDLLEDVHAPQPQEELVRQELERILEKLLSTLNDRQHRVLRLRFGMEDGACHSLEEIGTILGISKERTRQIEKQAIEKLQKLGAGLGLEDFLND